jgi:hypothetical protein
VLLVARMARASEFIRLGMCDNVYRATKEGDNLTGAVLMRWTDPGQ